MPSHTEIRSKKTGIPFPCYRGSTSWVPGSGATDVATFTAGNRRVHIAAVYIQASQTANALGNFRMFRRLSPNSGGTSTVLATICKCDLNAPDPTAVFRTYTASPDTLGTADGVIRTSPVPVSTASGGFGPITWEFIPNLPNGIVLRPGDIVAFDIGDISGTATAYLTIVWAEDTD